VTLVTPPRTVPGAAAGVPSLAFSVVGAAAEPHAAAPTLRFDLVVESRGESGGAPAAVRSLLLTTQIRIDVARRPYDRDEQARLVELFGPPERWRETLRSVYWTHATVVVPPFERRADVAVRVPCTSDFDVVAPKYFHGVQRGEVPLDFLFSGSVFYDDAAGALRTARLSWEAEAAYRLPVTVWKEMMEHYFPGAAWLRLGRDAFDRLYAFRAARALPTWDAAVDALLAGAACDGPPDGKPDARRER
jgi:hypothetical protein